MDDICAEGVRARNLGSAERETSLPETLFSLVILDHNCVSGRTRFFRLAPSPSVLVVIYGCSPRAQRVRVLIQ